MDVHARRGRGRPFRAIAGRLREDRRTIRAGLTVGAAARVGALPGRRPGGPFVESSEALRRRRAGNAA